MKNKKIYSYIKRTLICLLAAALLVAGIPMANLKIEASAATLTIADLQAKYPAGKYWNHAGNPGSENSKNNADGYTSTPCSVHGVVGTSKQTCNAFCPSGTQLSWQCMGYAEKLGYDSTGYNPRNNANGWYTYTSSSALDSLKPGDIVRYKNNNHSIFVTAVNGDTVTYTDCNSDGHCIIRWGATISKSTLRSTFTHVRSTPYSAGNCTSFASDSKYGRFKGFKAYLCTSENARCYYGDLTTSPGKIYTTDYCTINDVYTNGWCQVSCPWNDGTTKIVYTQISNFIKTPSTAISYFTASDYMNLYSSSSLSTKIFRVYPNDICYTIGSSGSATQIFMPHTDGYYVLGWVQSSQISSSSGSSGSTVDSRYPTPFKCRVLSTSKVPAAVSVGGERQSNLNVYVDDDCVIKEVYTNGWCKFDCPWNDGSTKTLYLPLSEFINANIAPYTINAPRYAVTYLKSDAATQWGWIDENDSVTIVSTVGSMSQVIYPASVGKRCAWAYSSELKATYTVSFNANGGVGAPATQTKTSGSALTLSSVKPTRTGYTFIGWSTSSTASSAGYSAGSIYTDDASITLYAVWRINQYQISYNANGGIGAPSNQSKNYGTDIKLSTVEPTQNGFVFLGWSENATASSATYKAGAVFNENRDVKLYAVWEAVPVNITGISILNEPNVTEYYVGDDFSAEGLVLSAKYSNDITEEVRTGFTVSAPDMNTAGTKSVTVTFKGQSTSFEIIVNENPFVQGTLKINKSNVSIGEEFNVDIDINDNKGLAFLKIHPNYDSTAIEFIGAVNGNVIADDFSSTGNVLMWDADEDSVESGKLATLKFKAFKEGDYDIGLICDSAFNADEKNVELSFEGISIKIKPDDVMVDDKTTETDPQLVVSKVTGKPGETVDVTISVKNNPGMVATRVYINYDKNILTLNKISDGGLLGNNNMVAGNDLSSNPYAIIFEDSLSTVNYKNDGILVTLSFTINEGAETGVTPIGISYDPGSTFNCELDEVKFAMIDGSIEISNRNLGDANNDGIVNLKDVALIKRALAGGFDVAIDESNADVNGDGVVNLKDVAMIKRWLAGGYNVEIK